MTRTKVVIFGAGQGARTATRYMHEDGGFDVVGYAVDREFLDERMLNGRPIVAADEMTAVFPPDSVLGFVALGAANMNTLRAERYARMKDAGYRMATYVHSSVHGYGFAVGDNCLILDGQTINHDVVIGSNVIIWSGCHLGDRSRIEDGVFMASHIVVNGDCVIGERSYVGSNATIAHGVRVGTECFIGANALIAEDTPDGSAYVVSPTKAIALPSRKFVRLLRHSI